MPGFVSEPLQRSPRLAVTRVCCDGRDPQRLHDEVSPADGLWVILSGTFRVRSAHGTERVDPMTAMRWRRGMGYQVQHDHGGDVCLSVRGALASELVDGAAGPLPISSEAFVALRRACALLRGGDSGALLAFEAALVTAATDANRSRPANSPRTRALARALADTLRTRLDEKVSLTELAERHGVSPFHACAAFRAATGTSLHQYHLEVRLRHALALVLDTERPIGALALDTGFASQAHLTARFTRRFGISPARCRRSGLPGGAGARALGLAG